MTTIFTLWHLRHISGWILISDFHLFHHLATVIAKECFARNLMGCGPSKDEILEIPDVVEDSVYPAPER